MKRIVYLISMFACLLFASCEKEMPGMTETVDLAGQWYVQVDYVDGEDVYEDYYGIGRILMLTYNTSANKADEMIIDDLGNFWEFKVKVGCDVEKRSFSADAAGNLVAGYEDLICKVSNGKVVVDGTETPSGQKADYIEFYIEFSDDEPGVMYKISGWRYTGFVNDD